MVEMPAFVPQPLDAPAQIVAQRTGLVWVEVGHILNGPAAPIDARQRQ